MLQIFFFEAILYKKNSLNRLKIGLNINEISSAVTSGPQKKETSTKPMGLKDVAPFNNGFVEILTGKELPNMGLKDVAPLDNGLVEILTGKELPNMGLKDVAPVDKGLVEILTGKELPNMGLKDVAPVNKGLVQVIIDWFK